MKYLYLGLFILCMLICACWLTQREIGLRTEAIAAPLEDALRSVQTADAARGRQLLAQSAQLWEAHEGFFASLMSHSYTQEIDEALAVREGVRDSELPRFLLRLLHAVQVISDADQPLWHNIF